MPSLLTPATTPEARFRAWLQLHDQEIANRAVEATNEENGPCAACRDVRASQFRALHNTANMCGTVGELRAFIRSRFERRRKAGKSSAPFWDGLNRELGDLKNAYLEPAADACGIEETSSETIQTASFDVRTAYLLIARVYIEHIAVHGQYVSHRST